MGLAFTDRFTAVPVAVTGNPTAHPYLIDTITCDERVQKEYCLDGIVEGLREQFVIRSQKLTAAIQNVEAASRSRWATPRRARRLIAAERYTQLDWHRARDAAAARRHAAGGFTKK